MRGVESSRVVGPLGLVNKAGIWYLVATAAAAAPATAPGMAPARDDATDDAAGRDPAVFRVGRVSTAAVLPREFTRPPDFDLAAFWSSWSASFMTSLPQARRCGYECRQTRSRCSPRCSVLPCARPWRRRRPPTSAGSVRSALTFEHEAAAVQRLAGFGGQLEVLSPPGVRARLIATARALLATL